MKIFFVLLLLYQFFYFTSCNYNSLSVRNGQNKSTFFRKDYRFFESRQSFYKFHTTHRTWLDAKKRCTLEGASMWYPEDQEEVDLMVEYWKERQPSLLRLHVGISDLLSEGQWETVEGQPVEEIWNGWGPGEPNNGLGRENCGVMRRDFYIPGGIDLNDEYCGLLQPFICKKTLASLDWNYLCDMPDLKYIFDNQLGKCYKFHLKPLSWNEAYTVCTAEESYLAIINSEKEKDVLVKLVADAHTEKLPGGIRFVHLGFHNKFGEGWQTVTRTSLDETGYVAWGKNQPDGGGNETCGTMFFDGLYNDLGCDKEAFFICEHDIALLSQPVEEIWNGWGPGEPNNGLGRENCGVMRRDFYIPGGIDLNDEYCGLLQPFICKKTLASLDWNYLCDMPDLKYIFDNQLGKCYKFHLKPLSWNEAYTVCTAEESYLAIINSEKEKDVLVKLVADAHTEKLPGGIRFVHLGFHNKFGEGWQTVTRTSLDETGYVAWGKNQPDGGGNETCGTMFFDGLYNDLGCDKEAFFICEHDIALLSNALDERILSVH